jgi:hypothetical protein
MRMNTQQEIEYVRALSKDALRGQGHIQIKRNRDYELYYATSSRGQYTTWHLYPKGEGWLGLHGYGEGDCIDLRVAMYLQEIGLSYTEGSRSRTVISPRPPQDPRLVAVEDKWKQFVRTANLIENYHARFTALRENPLVTRAANSKKSIRERLDNLASLSICDSSLVRGRGSVTDLLQIDLTQLNNEIADLDRRLCQIEEEYDRLQEDIPAL